MKITPVFVGSGRASQALREAFRIVEVVEPEIAIQKFVPVPRQAKLNEVLSGVENAVVCVSSPHAFHAPKIIEAANAGAKLIMTEKPTCVSPEQLRSLQNVKTPVAVFHGYRQMWGVQAIKKMVAAGEMGDLVTIEGRYWQSSAAQRALVAKSKSAVNWKDDVSLSGSFDTLIDIAVHWVDAAFFLAGKEAAEKAKLEVWRSFKNAESSHRDTHVHLTAEFGGGIRGLASVSKTVHGAGNHFEINVIGTMKSATWKFIEADQIEIGEGAKRSIVARPREDATQIHPPFHGLGWVEGYVQIVREALREISGKPFNVYPTLQNNLLMMEKLFSALG